MREIARQIGMSQSTMRHYFPTKLELLDAVLDQRHQAATHEATRRSSGQHSFVDDIGAVVADNATQPDIVRLLTILSTEAIDSDHPAHEFFAQRCQRRSAGIAYHLNEAIRTGEISPAVETDAAARVLLAVMSGLEAQWLLDPTTDMVRLFENHVRHYFAPKTVAKPDGS